MKILRQPTLITIDVIYWRPDYSHILQEFLWQTSDHIPDYPRLKKFINFWRTDINAVIQQVLVAESNAEFRPVDLMSLLN